MNEHGLRRQPRLPKIVVEDVQPLDFQAFHALHRGPYVRWAELYLGSRADAEDAVDGAMLELLSHWTKVLQQPEPAAYAWWLVKNRIKDAARHRTRQQKLADAIFATKIVYDAIDPIGELETAMVLWTAIDELPERQHDVVLLHALGYETRETAGVLGITEATVRSTLRDARRRLAAAFGLDPKKGRDDDRTAQ